MTHLTLTEHPSGVTLDSESAIVFDLKAETAHFGSASVDSSALVWALDTEPRPDALLSADLSVDQSHEWVMRCDRIDFPPGGIAYRHTHPGPGIRYQLFGQLTVTAAGQTESYQKGGVWFESGPEPVLAEASMSEPSAFVRVLLLPAEWAGKRTIRYVDPADESKPKLQKATVYIEHAVRWPNDA